MNVGLITITRSKLNVDRRCMWVVPSSAARGHAPPKQTLLRFFAGAFHQFQLFENTDRTAGRTSGDWPLPNKIPGCAAGCREVDGN